MEDDWKQQMAEGYRQAYGLPKDATDEELYAEIRKQEKEGTAEQTCGRH